MAWGTVLSKKEVEEREKEKAEFEKLPEGVYYCSRVVQEDGKYTRVGMKSMIHGVVTYEEFTIMSGEFTIWGPEFDFKVGKHYVLGFREYKND